METKSILIVKLILILTVGYMLFFIVGNRTVEAAADFEPNTYYINENNRKEAGSSDELANIGKTIIGVIRTIGSLASVAVLIVLGIKYMAGSLEEKAQYKQSMIPYVVGAVLVFGITNLLAIIIDLAVKI